MIGPEALCDRVLPLLPTSLGKYINESHAWALEMCRMREADKHTPESTKFLWEATQFVSCWALSIGAFMKLPYALEVNIFVLVSTFSCLSDVVFLSARWSSMCDTVWIILAHGYWFTQDWKIT